MNWFLPAHPDETGAYAEMIRYKRAERLLHEMSDGVLMWKVLAALADGGSPEDEALRKECNRRAVRS